MITIVKTYSSQKFDEIYQIFNDNTMIGSISILYNSINMINIYIDEKYRGYGYGSDSFRLILEQLKNKKILKIMITIPVNNIIMMRIINHYKNMIKNKNNELITYELINE
ncbi:MAG: GNAT family N-acetyltransferase [Bacilli bacterium]|nr:GNAT family N-acetyltransferase [Bacilli bacterium]